MRRTVSVAITAIAAGGDGVARSEGLVVFVPRTAPGDVVTASIAGRGHFARGALRSIQTESPDRVSPPCPHYTRDRCGGCQLQHMSYSSQLGAKRQMIADAMRRIGRREVALPDITPSPAEWRYRVKLTMALRRRGDGWIAGLHAYDEPAHVFPVADCPITDRRVLNVWQEILRASRFFPAATSLRGSVRWTDDGPAFVLTGANRWSDWASFFDAVPSLGVLYWEPEAQPRRLLSDRRPIATPTGSFAQVNPATARLVGDHVRELVRASGASSLVDAYSGSGDLSASLSAGGVTCTAIELDPDAAGWAAQRLEPPSRSLQGRVEDRLSSALPSDVVVLNPPRGGLHESVPQTLAEGDGPGTVIYVSCDPATLARDVARMPGFTLESVRAFDMFPQTAHVETVCVLKREP